MSHYVRVHRKSNMLIFCLSKLISQPTCLKITHFFFKKLWYSSAFALRCWRGGGGDVIAPLSPVFLGRHKEKLRQNKGNKGKVETQQRKITISILLLPRPSLLWACIFCQASILFIFRPLEIRWIFSIQAFNLKATLTIKRATCRTSSTSTWLIKRCRLSGFYHWLWTLLKNSIAEKLTIEAMVMARRWWWWVRRWEWTWWLYLQAVVASGAEH